MSGKPFSQLHIVCNSRQSQSRGYGRPKTRSPFPATVFSHNGSLPHPTGNQFICIGNNTGLFLAGRKVRPHVSGSGLVFHDDIKKAGTQPHRPGRAATHFASLTKADSVDSENSYNKITFYNPPERGRSFDPEASDFPDRACCGRQVFHGLQNRNINRINDSFNRPSPIL